MASRACGPRPDRAFSRPAPTLWRGAEESLWRSPCDPVVCCPARAQDTWGPHPLRGTPAPATPGAWARGPSSPAPPDPSSHWVRAPRDLPAGLVPRPDVKGGWGENVPSCALCALRPRWAPACRGRREPGGVRGDDRSDPDSRRWHSRVRLRPAPLSRLVPRLVVEEFGGAGRGPERSAGHAAALENAGGLTECPGTF